MEAKLNEVYPQEGPRERESLPGVALPDPTGSGGAIQGCPACCEGGKFCLACASGAPGQNDDPGCSQRTDKSKCDLVSLDGGRLPVVVLDRAPSIGRLSAASVDSSGESMVSISAVSSRAASPSFEMGSPIPRGGSPALGKFFRGGGKRGIDELSSDSASGSDYKDAGSKRSQATKKSRSRPLTHGDYVGMHKARAEYNRLKKESLALQEEEEFALLASKARKERVAKPLTKDLYSEEQLATEITKRVEGDVEVILNVVKKSRNLKGSFQKALKEAAASIVSGMKLLADRIASEELERVQALNKTQQEVIKKKDAELEDLRTEVIGLRADIDKLRASILATGRDNDADVEELPPAQEEKKKKKKIERPQAAPVQAPQASEEEKERAMFIKLGNMMNARLEAFESRLPPEKMRPPLAADNKVDPARTTPGPSASGGAPTASGQVTKNQRKKAKKKAKEEAKKTGTVSGVAASAPQKEQKAAAPKPPLEGEWVKVGKNGKAAKAKGKAQPSVAAKPLSPKAKMPDLRPPKSAAVVLTLQPAAVQRGCTYKEVLQTAKSKIEFASLGITGGLRFKKAATGAVILELPGATSGPKADLLAAKLQETFSKEDLRIARPEKCADVRISGLDYSVTKEELVAAVAAAAECQPLQISTSELRFNARGSGSAVVRLPVSAAKKLGDGRRLLVGWMSVQARVLPPRQTRCLRCLERGHVGANCKSEVDLGGACFRCGEKGHRAAGCEATPHCAKCAAAGRMANHLLDDRGCCALPPSLKKGGARKEAAGPAEAVSQPLKPSATVAAPATSREEDMETAG